MLDIIILLLVLKLQFILKAIIKYNQHDFVNNNLSLNFIGSVFETLITDIVVYYTFKKLIYVYFIFLICRFYLKHF